jgi:hypothetical protein
MSYAVIDNPQERAWDEAEAATCALMGTINAATAALVEVVVRLIANGGWGGWGIRSVEHWVMWKANVSRHRARGLVWIARRRDELPVCWALFVEGRITEDAMVRIARRVPAERDAEVAGWAQIMMIGQLTRVLSSLPPVPNPDPNAPEPPDPERDVSVYTRQDGWLDGSFCLPPDEGAVVMTALTAARDAELRDRNEGRPAERPKVPVSWADGFVRLAQEGCDALDATFQRTGHRGERHQVVLHRNLADDGSLGPARLHLGEYVPDPVARYMGCDAKVLVQITMNGRFVGVVPTDRTPNRRLRRHLEHRDGGCAHPLCTQRRWLHAHHLQHWEHGGLTVPSNLLSLCPAHHRAHHMGDFTIRGDPEAGDLEFFDPLGRQITAPTHAPPDIGPCGTFVPPSGERLSAWAVGWN